MDPKPEVFFVFTCIYRQVMSFWGILSLDNNDLFSRNKIGLFHDINPKVPFVWGVQLFLRASDWPDTLVTVWPHQLVELVESCQVYVRQQRRAAHALLQVLPHSVVAESVQDELQLQDRLQPPLLRLLPLQLLPPSRLLHHLLDLMTATVKGHCQPARMRQHTNTLGGWGRPYVLSQYHKGLLQFPCKFQVIHDLLVFGQGLLKRWKGVKSCARLGYNIFVCASGCQEYLYPPADHDWDSPRCSFWLDNHRACSVMQQCRVMTQEVGDGLQWDTEAVDCRSTAVVPAGWRDSPSSSPCFGPSFQWHPSLVSRLRTAHTVTLERIPYPDWQTALSHLRSSLRASRRSGGKQS